MSQRIVGRLPVWRSVSRLVIGGVTSALAALVVLIFVAFVAAQVPAGDGLEPFKARHAVSTDHRDDPVRQIQLSKGGRQAWVLRQPAQWERVDVMTGAVEHHFPVAATYRSQIQRIGTETDAVLYSGEHGVFIKSPQEQGDGRKLFSVDEEIFDIAASPEHDRIACNRHMRIELWSAIETSLIASVEVTSGLSDLQWSPDGRRLLCVMANGELQIRDGMTLELERSQATDLMGCGIGVWSRDGRHVAVHNNSSVLIAWEITGKSVKTVHTGTHVMFALGFAPDGRFLVFADAENDVWMIPVDAADVERRYVGSASAAVVALCLADDGESLLVGAIDGSLECWSMSTGIPLWTKVQPQQRAKTAPTPSAAPINPAVPLAQRGASCASTRS